MPILFPSVKLSSKMKNNIESSCPTYLHEGDQGDKKRMARKDYVIQPDSAVLAALHGLQYVLLRCGYLANPTVGVAPHAHGSTKMCHRNTNSHKVAEKRCTPRKSWHVLL